MASYTYKTLTFLIALVWMINGLFCKVLNLIPRHKEIVARILGQEWSSPLTTIIGVSEILMMMWILSGIKRRLNVIVQILVIAAMNIIEFLMAPDLLLFGRINIVVASLFIGLVYYWGILLPAKIQTAHARIS